MRIIILFLVIITIGLLAGTLFCLFGYIDSSCTSFKITSSIWLVIIGIALSIRGMSEICGKPGQ